jgi:hypothetical protein
MPKLNPKHEKFCQLYAKNSELFGNGTLCYAETYTYKLDTLSRERLKDSEGKEQPSEYERAYNVCSVEANRLLRNPRIDARLTKLLNEMLRDDIVDRELAKTILQDRKLEPKISAIREYNKLKQRIIEKVEHSGSVSISNILDSLDGPKTRKQRVADQPPLQDQE